MKNKMFSQYINMRQHIHLGRHRAVHRHHIVHALHSHHLAGHHFHHVGMGTPAVKKEGGRMVAHPTSYKITPQKHGAGRKPLKFRL
jgi:hypothetical protein